jgi:tetratricopeptide (TPR) repeat protein
MERFRELKAHDMEVLKDRNSARDDLKALRGAVAETLVMAGTLHAALESPARAEELWVRAASLDPRNVPGRLRLAARCQKDNRLKEALKWCRELCALEPAKVHHFLNAGLLNARLGRFEDAERAFLAAMGLSPGNPWPCRDLARLYLSQERNLARARELAQQAVDLEPSAQSYFILSWACDRGGDLPAALDAMQKAVELAPDNPEFRRKYDQLASRR